MKDGLLQESWESDLIRIDMPRVVDTLDAIGRLTELDPHSDRFNAYVWCISAKDMLNQLYNSSVYGPHLRVSLMKAHLLSRDIDVLIDKLTAEGDEEIQEWPFGDVKEKSNDLLGVLRSEISAMPVFLVQPKGGYDVSLLTYAGWELFPPRTAMAVPQAENDMLEAGKALAFQLPTACVFHVFRVLEAVLRSYWKHVTDGKEDPKNRTIGGYVEALKTGEHGDEKVHHTLRQIKDFHRNPVAHPETFLTIDEAIASIGISNSIITEMLKVIPDHLQEKGPAD